MYDRRFFQSKLGQAAIASVASMVLMIALTTQMHTDPAYPGDRGHEMVELA